MSSGNCCDKIFTEIKATYKRTHIIEIVHNFLSWNNHQSSQFYYSKSKTFSGGIHNEETL
jgi:hypothetical protein